MSFSDGVRIGLQILEMRKQRALQQQAEQRRQQAQESSQAIGLRQLDLAEREAQARQEASKETRSLSLIEKLTRARDLFAPQRQILADGTVVEQTVSPELQRAFVEVLKKSDPEIAGHLEGLITGEPTPLVPTEPGEGDVQPDFTKMLAQPTPAPTEEVNPIKARLEQVRTVLHQRAEAITDPQARAETVTAIDSYLDVGKGRDAVEALDLALRAQAGERRYTSRLGQARALLSASEARDEQVDNIASQYLVQAGGRSDQALKLFSEALKALKAANFKAMPPDKAKQAQFVLSHSGRIIKSIRGTAPRAGEERNELLRAIVGIQQ